MKAFLPFFLLTIIASIVYTGTKFWHGHIIFGVIIPYLCFAVGLAGFIIKIIRWAASPVPFNITTSYGQQKSLSFIKPNRIESPASGFGVFMRMLLEVLFFRSLLRNDKVILYGQDKRLVYGSDRYLWMASVLFHWSLLIIVLRHLRFFLEPVPNWVLFLQDMDSAFRSNITPFYISQILISIGILYLFLRRFKKRIMYISLPSDYFALFLIGGIILSGILMRYIYRADLLAVKAFIFGLMYLKPLPYTGFGAMFYVHICLVSILMAYLPYSKLMHMAGIFLSPTRNMANDSRMRRHINPWNYPVNEHTYEEWEEEFKDALKEAEIPLDREGGNAK
ncbi:MAG TPA: sulfate reduction electron transfer complex DsrMKJOP subunit DsrM [Syntrophorhabdaceae bacterium]|nr:sulfate reduction electron transfer complex DsrMKJOP subunit DsrM [Syntrophorhabdaceae bacterium]